MTKLSQRFLDYDRENPEVRRLFFRFAHEAIAAGRKKLSASLIFERIRWEMTVTTRGDDFKVNNNYRADYARLFMLNYGMEDIFATRTRTVSDLREVA